MNAEQLRTSSCDRRCANAERSHLSPTPQNFSEINTLHWCVNCTKYIKLRAQWTGVPVRLSIYLYPQLLNKFRWTRTSSIKLLSFWFVFGRCPFRIVCCGISQTLHTNASASPTCLPDYDTFNLMRFVPLCYVHKGTNKQLSKTTLIY